MSENTEKGQKLDQIGNLIIVGIKIFSHEYTSARYKIFPTALYTYVRVYDFQHSSSSFSTRRA